MSRGGPAWLIVGVLASLSACRAEPSRPPVPAVRQRPHEAVLAVGSRWESRQRNTGRLSLARSSIAVASDTVAVVVLHGESPRALVTEQVTETFQGAGAASTQCRSELRYDAAVAYGHRKGEVALQLEWPATVAVRRCRGGALELPELERPAGAARFVLRSDRLIAVEPALEKRQFIPVD